MLCAGLCNGIFFCAKKIPDNGRFVADKKLVFPLTTIIVIIWLLGILEGAKVAGFEVGRWYRMILCGMDCLCCVYALIVQINQKKSDSASSGVKWN